MFGKNLWFKNVSPCRFSGMNRIQEPWVALRHSLVSFELDNNQVPPLVLPALPPLGGGPPPSGGRAGGARRTKGGALTPGPCGCQGPGPARAFLTYGQEGPERGSGPAGRLAQRARSTGPGRKRKKRAWGYGGKFEFIP